MFLEQTHCTISKHWAAHVWTCTCVTLLLKWEVTHKCNTMKIGAEKATLLLFLLFFSCLCARDGCGQRRYVFGLSVRSLLANVLSQRRVEGISLHLAQTRLSRLEFGGQRSLWPRRARFWPWLQNSSANSDDFTYISNRHGCKLQLEF